MTERAREPFADLAHQRASVSLGMWVFIAQEVLFFGVLFVWYGTFRADHGTVVVAAGSKLDWQLATVMTVVLLVSSFTMALGVRFAMLRARRALALMLAATLLLGAAFLAMKGYEYHHHLTHGDAPFLDLRALAAGATEAQFFGVYFVMTGFHALHVIGGLVVIAALCWASLRRPELPRWTFVMALGLYWHFVDVVWLFLYPALYLVGRAP